MAEAHPKPVRKKASTHVYTSLVLPKMLHTELRKAALDESRDMTDLLEDAVKDYLGKKRRTAHL